MTSKDPLVANLVANFCYHGLELIFVGSKCDFLLTSKNTC